MNRAVVFYTLGLVGAALVGVAAEPYIYSMIADNPVPPVEQLQPVAPVAVQQPRLRQPPLAQSQLSMPVDDQISGQPVEEASQYDAEAQPDTEIQASDPPPPLPDYVQPPLPEPDYVWTPGYWSYADGYYWVPGSWVEPPQAGLLWTPGYWGWSGVAYLFHRGYWGRQVGFYGGIAYGHGYDGEGYHGGYWQDGHLHYNTAVNRIDHDQVYANLYSQPVVELNPGNRISYSGGRGGVTAQPTVDQQLAAHERAAGPTPVQIAQRRQAMGAPQNRPGYTPGNNSGQPQYEQAPGMRIETGQTARLPEQPQRVEQPRIDQQRFETPRMVQQQRIEQPRIDQPRAEQPHAEQLRMEQRPEEAHFVTQQQIEHTSPPAPIEFAHPNELARPQFPEQHPQPVEPPHPVPAQSVPAQSQPAQPLPRSGQPPPHPVEQAHPEPPPAVATSPQHP